MTHLQMLAHFPKACAHQKFIKGENSMKQVNNCMNHRTINSPFSACFLISVKNTKTFNHYTKTERHDQLTTFLLLLFFSEWETCNTR